MVEAVVKDKKRVLPCVAHLQGEYGIHDLFMGVPTVIGANGIERILELRLNASEFDALQKSADAVKGQVARFRGQTLNSPSLNLQSPASF